MAEPPPDIVLLEARIGEADLRRLVERYENMVKYVVDVERRALVGEGEPL